MPCRPALKCSFTLQRRPKAVSTWVGVKGWSKFGKCSCLKSQPLGRRENVRVKGMVLVFSVSCVSQWGCVRDKILLCAIRRVSISCRLAVLVLGPRLGPGRFSDSHTTLRFRPASVLGGPVCTFPYLQHKTALFLSPAHVWDPGGRGWRWAGDRPCRVGRAEAAGPGLLSAFMTYWAAMAGVGVGGHRLCVRLPSFPHYLRSSVSHPCGLQMETVATKAWKPASATGVM